MAPVNVDTLVEVYTAALIGVGEGLDQAVDAACQAASAPPGVGDFALKAVKVRGLLRGRSITRDPTYLAWGTWGDFI